MALTKRPRELVDDESFDVTDVKEARSNLRLDIVSFVFLLLG